MYHRIGRVVEIPTKSGDDDTVPANLKLGKNLDKLSGVVEWIVVLAAAFLFGLVIYGSMKLVL